MAVHDEAYNTPGNNFDSDYVVQQPIYLPRSPPISAINSKTQPTTTTTTTTTTTPSSLPEVPNAREMVEGGTQDLAATTTTPSIAGAPEYAPPKFTEEQQRLKSLANKILELASTLEEQKLKNLATNLLKQRSTPEQLEIATHVFSYLTGGEGIGGIFYACNEYFRTHKMPCWFSRDEVGKIIKQIYRLSQMAYKKELSSYSSTSAAEPKNLKFDEHDKFVLISSPNLTDFSRGLLDDEITPENIILPIDGHSIQREGMPAVKTSETFTDEDGILPKEFLKSSQALGPEEDKDKLFLRMPCLEDILQGETTKDCYLLGVLQTIVNKNPKIILRMMRDDGDGTVTVRLFDEQGNPHYYIIAKMLCRGFAKNCMWVQMVERAFLIHRRCFPSSRDLENRRIFHNTSIDIQSGFEQDGLRSTLDILEIDLEIISLRSKVKIILDKKNGLTVIGADEEAIDWPCVKNHAYAILGYMHTPPRFYILVTEPHRGSLGKSSKLPGVNYDPETGTCEEVLGYEKMWLRLDDFTTPEELKYIIHVFDEPEFKYLEEKGRQYYEQQRKNKAVE